MSDGGTHGTLTIKATGQTLTGTRLDRSARFDTLTLFQIDGLATDSGSWATFRSHEVIFTPDTPPLPTQAGIYLDQYTVPWLLDRRGSWHHISTYVGALSKRDAGPDHWGQTDAKLTLVTTS